MARINPHIRIAKVTVTYTAFRNILPFFGTAHPAARDTTGILAIVFRAMPCSLKFATIETAVRCYPNSSLIGTLH